MNREIKFRAWDTEKKIMWESDFHISNSGNISYFWEDENNGYTDKKWGENVVLVQYPPLLMSLNPFTL